MRETALSVSDAMALAKSALETLSLRVVGEVSEATIKPGYRAVYFSLKDGAAVMPCLMWRSEYERSGVTLEDGKLVEVSGTFTAYIPKGRMQFQVRSIVVAGEGMLRLEVARRLKLLQEQGLLSDARKRPLPRYPERIGVVTSPRGKAIHDIIRTLRRRYPVAEVVVAGVQVEGEGAVEDIVRGLEALAEEQGIDVIIVGRGGGSYEDLMPFNSEEVARAIAASPVPVVTGIGHEPDVSIADMVADARASTPTAAAEAAAPDVAEVRRVLDAHGKTLARALAHAIAVWSHRLDLIARRPLFASADELLGTWYQKLDLLAAALERELPAQLARCGEAVMRGREALWRAGERLTPPFEASLEHMRERTIASGRALVEDASISLERAGDRLGDLSPVAILQRGYAVCYAQDGSVLHSAADVMPGDPVDVRLAEGSLGCRVESVRMEE